MHRLFCDRNLVPGEEVTISPDDLHHVKDVLRMRDGEKIALVDPSGVRGEGTVMRGEGFAVICTQKDEEPTVEAGGEVVLCMGLAKGEKFDLVIQKTVELGVSTIIPVQFMRCVAKISGKDEEKKLTRWNRISREAAMQSGRTKVPEVTRPVTVDVLCEEIRDRQTLLAYEMEREISLRTAMQRMDHGEKLYVIVGPEGGIDETEAQKLCEAGAESVSLGQRILRCETAPIALMSVIEYERGGMEAAR